MRKLNDLLVQWRSVANATVGLRVFVIGCEPALARYFCAFLEICGNQHGERAPSAPIAFDKAQASRLRISRFF